MNELWTSFRDRLPSFIRWLPFPVQTTLLLDNVNWNYCHHHTSLHHPWVDSWRWPARISPQLTKSAFSHLCLELSSSNTTYPFASYGFLSQLSLNHQQGGGFHRSDTWLWIKAVIVGWSWVYTDHLASLFKSMLRDSCLPSCLVEYCSCKAHKPPRAIMLTSGTILQIPLLLFQLMRSVPSIF